VRLLKVSGFAAAARGQVQPNWGHPRTGAGGYLYAATLLYLYTHYTSMALRTPLRTHSPSAAIPTRFTRRELDRMERAVELLGLPSRSAFIRDAVAARLQEVETAGVIEFRNLTEAEALRRIDTHLREHPGRHYVSELVEVLGIEPRIAFHATQKLIDRGRARLGRT